MMQLSQVSQVVHGKLVGDDLMLSGVSINTRADCQDRLFVALEGENFDAHEFIDDAQKAGAGAAMIERDVKTSLPVIKVADTHQALKELAAWWRSQFVIPVVGVTGSVGKTSVKEMLGFIFSEVGQGVVTHGNLNNEIGVPLTLMRLSEGDRYAIVEMGMNHAGEISRISNMTRPTIALINNAAAAHLEGLGSIEAVARAKGEIFEGLAADGVAIINNDDAFAEQWLSLVGNHKVVTFAINAPADVTASFKNNNDSLVMKVHAHGKTFKLELRAVGEHNVSNALAAIATSLAANIPVSKIRAGLEAYRPISGRLNLSRVGDVLMIDDTYNANPLSMKAAIKVVSQYPQNTLIVGDMGELGSAAQHEHQRLGEIAAELGIQALLACGEYAQTVVQAYQTTNLDKSGQGYAKSFSEQSALIDYVTNNIHSGAVLVKGSRSTKMERVVAALTESLQGSISHSPEEEH